MSENLKYKIALLIFFLLIFILFLHSFEGTGDFYHHVNAGRYIIENKSFPNLDTYSFTAKNMPWVAHSWGSGLIFYILLSSFGQISITLFNAYIAVSTLLLLYLLIRSYGPSIKSSLATVALTAIAFSTRFPQRPEIFAYPLTLIILLIDSKKNKYPRSVYFLPLVILIWANVYGSAVLFGVGLVGLITIKQFIVDKFTIKNESIKLYAALILSIVASFINPYTYRTVFYFYLYIPKVSVYEGEWAGITKLISSTPVGQLLSLQYFILIYILYVFIFISLIIFSRKILKKFLFQTILSLSIILPFFAFRTFPLIAILCAPLISVCIEYVIHKKKYYYLLIPGSLSVIALYLSIWVNPPNLMPPQNPELKDLTSFIYKNNLSGNALNLGHFGGYITYKFYPNIKVYFDTRDELYLNSQAVKDLYYTYSANGSVIPLLNKYNADLVIADYFTDGMNYRDLFYSLDYVPVYLNDRYFIVMSKKLAQNKKLPILSFVDPFSKSAAKPGGEKEALSYYENLVKDNPTSLTNKLYLSSVLINLKKYDEAISVANKIEDNDKNLLGSLQTRNKAAILAQAYIEKRDCINTQNYLNIAQKPTGKMLIFTNDYSGQNYIPEALPFYYLICENDLPAANESLQSYLTTLGSPLEKLEVQEKFDALVKNL